jgi:hypothetical protein
MRNPAVLSAQIGAESQIFAERLKTAEAREAFTAFAERRAPDFHQSRLNFARHPLAAKWVVLGSISGAEGCGMTSVVCPKPEFPRCLSGPASNAARNFPKAVRRHRPARSAKTNGSM